MKNRYLPLAMILSALMITGCSGTDTSDMTAQSTNSATEQTRETGTEVDLGEARFNGSLQGIQYSNMVDKESQEIVKKALMDADIPEENISRFFERVNEFNDTVPNDSLVKSGFKDFDLNAHPYDLAQISESWQKEHPQYPGTNCRLNTFILGEEGVELTPAGEDEVDTNWLFIDKEAIANAQETLIADSELNDFYTRYARIPTTKEKDTEAHIKDIEDYLAQHEISFTNPKVDVVSVYIHDTLDDPAHLFIGHTGIAVPYEDGYLFVEKLAFDQPYQAVKVKNMEQLSEYLTFTYDDGPDLEYGQPVIFDNGHLIDGYKPKE